MDDLDRIETDCFFFFLNASGYLSKMQLEVKTRVRVIISSD